MDKLRNSLAQEIEATYSVGGTWVIETGTRKEIQFLMRAVKVIDQLTEEKRELQHEIGKELQSERQRLYHAQRQAERVEALFWEEMAAVRNAAKSVVTQYDKARDEMSAATSLN